VLTVLPEASTQEHRSSRLARQDAAFHRLSQLFALLVLGMLTAIVVSLAIGAAPAFHKFGLRFIVNTDWNPVTEQFGGFVPIFGTLVTSAVALLLAIPLSFGVALFLTELCPVSLRTPLGIVIELLAKTSMPPSEVTCRLVAKMSARILRGVPPEVPTL